jgi:tyrosyl-tRNA synthetase
MDKGKKNIDSLIIEQLEAFKRGSVELIKEEELYEKIKLSILNNIPLKIKAGFDPTSPDIHLGHTVLLNKLKTFQDYGHEVFFIIGDFTAMIGDPTGKSETRKPLSKETVIENSKTYKEQAFKILNKNKTKILFNSWWLSNIKLEEFIKISSNYTVARMLEKDDFEKRFAANRPIAVHEFIYPLLQAYDSVFINADLELGGNDQKFNLVVGRELMKSFKLYPQVILTMPLLEGLDGINKMSKSLGNTIGIFDEPNDMFGKIMSVSDEMMMKYYELLSAVPLDELEKLKNDMKNGFNPLFAKKNLAAEMVERFYDSETAKKSSMYFEEAHQKRVNPEDIETITVDIKQCVVKTGTNVDFEEKVLSGNKNLHINLISLLTHIHAVPSNGEAKRLIKQGAVKIRIDNNLNKQNSEIEGIAKDTEIISQDSFNNKAHDDIYIDTDSTKNYNEKDEPINQRTPEGNEIEIRANSDVLKLPDFINEFVIKIGKKKIFKITINC